jgi:Putative peptidoglycan binding domain
MGGFVGGGPHHSMGVPARGGPHASMGQRFGHNRFFDNHRFVHNDHFFDHHRFVDDDHFFRHRNRFIYVFDFAAFGFPWWYPYPYPYYYGYPYDYAYDYGPDYDYQYWSNLAVSVQSELARRGYYHGKVDGVVGSGSRQAIRSFQAAQGLPVTGLIDPKLLKALGIEYKRA